MQKTPSLHGSGTSVWYESGMIDRIAHIRPVLLMSLALSMCMPAVAFADDGSAMGVQTGDLRIHTDSTDYNINTGDFTMPHHVSANRPGTQIDGDRAHGNGKRKIVVVEGHVVVHQQAGSQGIAGSGRSSEPSTLICDRLTVELASKTYTADGHVHFDQGLRNVTADRGVLHDVTHDLHLTGNVQINDADQSLSADSVDYNTRTEDVHAHDNVRITVPVQQGGGSPLGEPIGTPSPAHGKHRR